MDDLGLMCRILAEVSSLKGVAQSAPHVHDAYEHTLVTVAEVERLTAFADVQHGPDETRFLGPFASHLEAHFGQTACDRRTRSTLLKFAAVLHDVGKSATRTVETEGRIRFLGHERIGAEMAREVLARLRFSGHETRWIDTVVRNHMRPGWLLKGPPVSGKAIYRFFRDTGDAGIDVLILALADQLATRGDALQRDHWRDYLGLVHKMLDHYFRKPSEVVAPLQLVNGRDVMMLLNLPSGPRIGELLERVREAQAEGQVLTREQALDFLRELSE